MTFGKRFRDIADLVSQRDIVQIVERMGPQQKKDSEHKRGHHDPELWAKPVPKGSFSGIRIALRFCPKFT